MDGMIKFSGALGVAIFLVTVIVLAVVFLFNVLIYFLDRTPIHGRSKLSTYFLFSTMVILAFDGIFFWMTFIHGRRAWEQDEAVAFDERMFFAWIPAHIAAYFLLPFMMRFIHQRRDGINRVIDKWR